MVPQQLPVVTGKGEMFPAGRYRVIVEAKNAGFKQRVYLQGPSKGIGYLKGEAGKSRVVVAHKEWHLAIQNDGGKIASLKVKGLTKGRHTVIHSEDWTDNDFNDLIVKVVPLQVALFAQGGSGKDRIRQVGGWDNDWLDARGGGGNDRIRQRGDGGDVLRAGGAGRDRIRQRGDGGNDRFLPEAVEVETVFVSVAAEAEMCFEQLAAVARPYFSAWWSRP